MSNVGKFVVVTTNRRGVFAGVLTKLHEAKSEEERYVELENAQMCVHWSAETRGVLGLASAGPQEGSRVTAPIPSSEVWGVTSIMVATDEARRLWESKPWA